MPAVLLFVLMGILFLLFIISLFWLASRLWVIELTPTFFVWTFKAKRTLRFSFSMLFLLFLIYILFLRMIKMTTWVFLWAVRSIYARRFSFLFLLLRIWSLALVLQSTSSRATSSPEMSGSSTSPLTLWLGVLIIRVIFISRMSSSTFSSEATSMASSISSST